VLFAARLPRITPRAFAFALAAFVFGIAWYAYLPVRSAVVTASQLDPTRQLGLPPGESFWDNDHPASLSGFRKEVSGQEFKAGGTFAAMIDPQTYRSGGDAWGELMLQELTPLGVLLALGGIFALVRRREGWLAAALFLAFAVPSAFAIAYSIETDPQRYNLIPFAMFAALAGYAASAIVRALPPLRIATTAVVFALAGALFGINAHVFDQRWDSGAQAVIDAAAEKTPPDAVLIAPWLYATPLAYGAYVEHRLGDRIVVSSWLSENAGRVPEWLKRRPVYVIGRLFGSVPGYRLQKIPAAVDVYRVTR
jgi:hypothetical protein